MKKIDLFKVHMASNAAEEVAKVLNSGYIGQGQKVDEFENSLKKYFNYDYISTTNSGTSALHLALHLLKSPYGTSWLGWEHGDEVLTTAMTCTASNWPILANGLVPKWVDIDPRNLNMDLDDLARKVSSRTKVIVVVHWGGYPTDLDRVREIQEEAHRNFGFKPAVVEDAAHAFGSTYKGKFIGTHGNFTMYSLQAIKHVTSIDGGLLFSPDQELHRRAKLVRWYGIDRDRDRKDFRCEADVAEWGFKFHMNDVCAAVGNENLKHADTIISKHRENAAYYDKQLANVSGVQLLHRDADRISAFWIYSMLVDNRDGFYKWMDECGITVSQVHERNDKHTATMKYRSSLPTLDKTIRKIVSIPVGWWVTSEEREYIANCIKKGW